MAEIRTQRRLAAILAADVVGYSKLMGEDETGTLDRLKALRRDVLDPKISEYGGRIVKLMGDGVLVEFPSAVDAVEYAIDTQQILAGHNKSLPENSRMEFRMGINLGDVIVDGDDIYGDGVNIAARLEGLADTGGICVSAMIYEGVRGKLEVEFSDIGSRVVASCTNGTRHSRSGTSTTRAASNTATPFTGVLPRVIATSRKNAR